MNINFSTRTTHHTRETHRHRERRPFEARRVCAGSAHRQMNDEDLFFFGESSGLTNQPKPKMRCTRCGGKLKKDPSTSQFSCMVCHAVSEVSATTVGEPLLAFVPDGLSAIAQEFIPIESEDIGIQNRVAGLKRKSW